jgi:carbamoyl-phosphate synthase large subunit
MGVHTGDSITVAPAQRSPIKNIRSCATPRLAVLRKIGVDTGGSNVSSPSIPNDGQMVIIEMNPRVSRSSALASKATGFPIAKSRPSWRSVTPSMN